MHHNRQGFGTFLKQFMCGWRFEPDIHINMCVILLQNCYFLVTERRKNNEKCLYGICHRDKGLQRVKHMKDLWKISLWYLCVFLCWGEFLKLYFHDYYHYFINICVCFLSTTCILMSVACSNLLPVVVGLGKGYNASNQLYSPYVRTRWRNASIPRKEFWMKTVEAHR